MKFPVSNEQLSIKAGDKVWVKTDKIPRSDGFVFVENIAKNSPWRKGGNHIVMVEGMSHPISLCRVYPFDTDLEELK